MNIKEKVDMIYNWLINGDMVLPIGEIAGTYPSRIYKSVSGNFVYRHYGESAVKGTKKELQWLLENIFDDVKDYYIITTNGEMESTSNEFVESMEKEYLFTFWERNIWRNTETPVFNTRMKFREMLIKYQDIAREYYDNHIEDNIVYWAVSCGEHPVLRHWTFAV